MAVFAFSRTQEARRAPVRIAVLSPRVSLGRHCSYWHTRQENEAAHSRGNMPSYDIKQEHSSAARYFAFSGRCQRRWPVGFVVCLLAARLASFSAAVAATFAQVRPVMPGEISAVLPERTIQCHATRINTRRNRNAKVARPSRRRHKQIQIQERTRRKRRNVFII